MSLPASRGKYNPITNFPWEHISAFVKRVHPFSRLISAPLLPPAFPPFPMVEVVWSQLLFLSLSVKGARDAGLLERISHEGSRELEGWKGKLAGSSSLWY